MYKVLIQLKQTIGGVGNQNTGILYKRTDRQVDSSIPLTCHMRENDGIRAMNKLSFLLQT